MTDEKKKKVKRIAAIVIALVLATGALAFSVWRFVASIQKKIDSKNESNESGITATTDTRNEIPTLDFTGQGMFASAETILTNQIKFDSVGVDGRYAIRIGNKVYGDVVDTVGHSLTYGGSFATISIYIADTWTLNSSDFPTVPSFTDNVWAGLHCDLSDVSVQLPGGDLIFDVLKGSNPYISFGTGFATDEDYLPKTVEDLSHYVMFAVVPLHKNDGSSASAQGSWQYFRTQIYRLSDLFCLPTSGNGGGYAGYTEADLETAREQAVNDYLNSDLYKRTLQEKYDEGYAFGNEKYEEYGVQRYNDGFREGHSIGFSKAQNSVTTGKNLFLAILDAPFQLIRNIFNFKIFGIDISSVIFFIMSICLIGFALRKIRG